jgi:protein arginine kinase activator
MRCNICKKDNAIIHIREYTDIGVRKINLCLECALKRGLNTAVNNIDLLLADIIKKVLDIPTSNRKRGKKSLRQEISIVCPSCGMTLHDFSKQLKVGCPICYSVFEKIIDLIIYNYNNSLIYLGKLPDDIKKVTIQRSKLKQLKRELKESLDLEEYMKAAVIRDEIKKVKKIIQKDIRKIANR